jgi:hypothetical protein
MATSTLTNKKTSGTSSGGSSTMRLSNASIYEQMFRTRHRTAGRPVRDDDLSDVLFPSNGEHPVIVRVAERRAYAVVHEEQRGRLREVFGVELKVLRRRGVAEVARDAGVKLDEVSENA